MLRQQQDEAYLASLRADQEKERKKREERERKRRKEEEVQQQRLAEERRRQVSHTTVPRLSYCCLLLTRAHPFPSALCLHVPAVRACRRLVPSLLARELVLDFFFFLSFFLLRGYCF